MFQNNSRLTVFFQRSFYWVTIGCCVCGLLNWSGWSGVASAQEAARDPAQQQKPPSADDITRWINQLDSDRFMQRRTATEKLIRAGKPSVEPLARAIADSNLEVATRGVHVLRALALCGEMDTEEAADAALHQLAQSHASSAARLANDAIAILGEERERQAIEQLRQLGATVTVRVRTVGFQRNNSTVIEIGTSWRGTVKDLQRLKWLRDVPEIRFDGPRVTDEWIRPVTHMKSLTRLVIQHAGITDAALRHLQGLDGLLIVDLLYTPVTDACLPRLKQLKSIQMIHLYGTRVTPEGAARLQESMANAQVIFKNGAFMGIHCLPMSWPCEVTQVTADTAASRAGLRPKDAIIRYDGQDVSNFEELRELIAGNRAGDTVTVDVRRGQTYRRPMRAEPGTALGLEGETTPYGCKVTSIVEGGIAARVGLQVDDVIGEFNNARVTSIDQVRKAHTQAPAGGRTLIVFRRDSKKLSLRLTFGEWKADDVLR